MARIDKVPYWCVAKDTHKRKRWEKYMGYPHKDHPLCGPEQGQPRAAGRRRRRGVVPALRGAAGVVLSDAAPWPFWQASHRFAVEPRVLADRHYSRRSPGTRQFVPPGRCVVLVVPGAAAWVTSWPLAEYVRHDWPGAWMNSLFRLERRDLYLASELIRAAVAVTRHTWPEPPPLGLVTFVDAQAVRHKRDPGRCYLKAGFRRVGVTKGGLIAFQMLAREMPPPASPYTPQLSIFG